MPSKPEPAPIDAAERERILGAFDRIRVWQQGDRRAVHKPLLVLLELGRFVRGEPPMAEFAAIDRPLQSLLHQFGPAGSAGTRHYPFWHLTTDNLWQVKGLPAMGSRPPSATPTLTELREHHVRGGFSDEIVRALRSDPSLTAEIARRILAAHFPETLHPDVLDAVGLSLDDLPVTPEQAKRPAPARDPAFRGRVLQAYEFRCCICGYDIRLGHQYAGLEAAHIKWFQAGGPDVVENGLALCALHHKIFDLGAFTILPESFVLVFSQELAGSREVTARLLDYHGAPIILPQSKSYLPNGDFLRWHSKDVCKKPQRDL